MDHHEGLTTFLLTALVLPSSAHGLDSMEEHQFLGEIRLLVESSPLHQPCTSPGDVSKNLIKRTPAQGDSLQKSRPPNKGGGIWVGGSGGLR